MFWVQLLWGNLGMWRCIMVLPIFTWQTLIEIVNAIQTPRGKVSAIKLYRRLRKKRLKEVVKTWHLKTSWKKKLRLSKRGRLTTKNRCYENGKCHQFWSPNNAGFGVEVGGFNIYFSSFSTPPKVESGAPTMVYTLKSYIRRYLTKNRPET